MNELRKRCEEVGAAPFGFPPVSQTQRHQQKEERKKKDQATSNAIHNNGDVFIPKLVASERI